MEQENDFVNEEWLRAEAEKMVREQIEERGIHDPRLLNAFRQAPRHWFVPPQYHAKAYADGPLPIGLGQTISQPYMVAAMTNLLALRGDETVLEIGTGSGYQAAILSLMARSVHTIERHPLLAENARSLLDRLGFKNVFVHQGDGTLGWPPAAPYQGILVTAAAPRPPEPLLAQLDEGGLLVIPVGGREGQDLQRWTRTHGRVRRESLFPVAFVPLRGSHGWKDNEWEEE
jgi:protein-L-isoaspartate(D-aspartate) O-methyltransferase